MVFSFDPKQKQIYLIRFTKRIPKQQKLANVRIGIHKQLEWEKAYRYLKWEINVKNPWKQQGEWEWKRKKLLQTKERDNRSTKLHSADHVHLYNQALNKPTINNPIMPVNPRKFGLYELSGAPLLELADGEDDAAAVPLAAEALEETWLGYNDPRGLISNGSETT